MSKKFGKLLLFSAVAGAAAYGAYHYMQNKDSAPSPEKGDDTDDDFDDFSEDLDEDAEVTKERSYVSLNLDKAEAIATEAFHKAKEVIADSVQQVRDTVRSVTESQSNSETNFTDLTALNKEKEAKNEAAGEAAAVKESTETVTEETPETVKEEPQAPSQEADAKPAPENNVAEDEKVEEFFDDDL